MMWQTVSAVLLSIALSLTVIFLSMFDKATMIKLQIIAFSYFVVIIFPIIIQIIVSFQYKGRHLQRN